MVSLSNHELSNHAAAERVAFRRTRLDRSFR
jgi:hypothetical protein